MPISLAKQTLIQEFLLVKSDAEIGNTGNPSMVKIRSTNVGIEEERKILLGSEIWEQGSDETRFTFALSIKDIWLKEAFLTLADCNIMDNDKFLFDFEDNRIAMSEEEFQLAWGRLPPCFAMEIFECIHKVNPQWELQGVDNG